MVTVHAKLFNKEKIVHFLDALKIVIIMESVCHKGNVNATLTFKANNANKKDVQKTVVTEGNVTRENVSVTTDRQVSTVA